MTQHCLLPIQEPCLLLSVSMPVPLSIRTERVWLTGEMTGLLLWTKKRHTWCLCPVQDHLVFQPFLWILHLCRKFLLSVCLDWISAQNSAGKSTPWLIISYSAIPSSSCYVPSKQGHYMTNNEYYCHIWAGTPPCHLSLLDRIQRCAAIPLGQELASSLEPLSVHCSVCCFFEPFL